MIFIDKKNRKIRIDADYDVEAYHEGKRIGSITFDENDGYTILFSMEVDPDYRRSGIATKMMEIAVFIHGNNFGKPHFNAVGGNDARAEDYYTQEGAAFIYSCIKKGVLVDTDLDEAELDYDNDPE